jgi:hypothetical protein
MVRIHPDPPTEYSGERRSRGHSSAGRAPALQAGGHRFDPGWLHHLQAKSAAKRTMSAGAWQQVLNRLFFKNSDEVNRVRFERTVLTG